MQPGRPGPPPDDLVTRTTRRVLPLLLVVAALAAMGRTAARPLSNVDTYFHLRIGHELLGGWTLRDPGSVSRYATADWVPTQWLPQVVMAWTEDHLGLAGVAWLSCLQLTTLVLALYVVARRRADLVVAAPLTLLAVLAASSGLSMRPQVLSYVFTALAAAVWLRAARDGRPPWLLVPATWVWATCHGMWPVGLSIGTFALVGMVLARHHTRAVLLRHGAVLAASAAAAAATPVGPRLYTAVLSVGSRAEYFAEWGPPQLLAPATAAAVVLLLVGFLVLLHGARTAPLDPVDVSLFVLACGWALYSQRSVPVAAAILVPLLAPRLQRLLGGARSAAPRSERLVVAGGYALTLVVVALLVPRTAEAPPPQPAWVDPALHALPHGTPLLNGWNQGGYVMWRYPHLEPVMHGYGDMFTDEELERNADLGKVLPGWDDDVRALGVSFALLSPDSALAYALELAGWRRLHHSETVELLQAPPGWFDEDAEAAPGD